MLRFNIHRFSSILYIFAKKDKGPILYTQKRYGKNGKPFKIIKFRTMIVNSDQYWDSHPDVYLLYKKNGNKLANDPRVTKIGKFIRNKSLDEFPQFINVLLGQMSLVGPRPILGFEIPEYGHHIHKLWFSKPGITGHWTTHGRSKILFPERAELELMYNKHHGLIYDIKCLGLTLIQTINGKDAYWNNKYNERNNEKNKKLALVASSGGHLSQLYLLKETWSEYDRFWVSFDKEDANALLKDEKLYHCYYPTNRNVKIQLKIHG